MLYILMKKLNQKKNKKRGKKGLHILQEP